MDTDELPPCYIGSLPTELLTTIFYFLPPKDLIISSRTCSRWKAIIDKITYDEFLWRDHCIRDFCDIFHAARNKASQTMNSFKLYRSLSVWPDLPTAREYRDEFAIATKMPEQIRGFRILGDGTLGVHTYRAIKYYCIDTFTPIMDRQQINGDYSSYNENSYFIALVDYNQHLYLVRKSIGNPKMWPHTTYDRVVKYVLVNKIVYFITLADEVFTTNADVENFASKFIVKVGHKVLSLGFKDRLHILTEHHDIYTLVDKKLVHITTISHDPSPLHQLQKHNIYDPFCWQTYFQTTRTVRLRDIVTVFKYGDVFFLGTCWGILHIYYAPFSSERLNLGNTEPMKRYNFFEKDNCCNNLVVRCPILQIDVIETDTGHTVLIAMPRKIAVLKYVHDFIDPVYYSVPQDDDNYP
nr:uncharacterized protein LOC128682951 [Plodia interpunctella]XP_053624006.1 uncharacterized protein LOC128682951 [Plodia interpunctella]XP_053624007.1 uncharacterized protein LOC128682951 [Plodia interpunctella]